jgi:DUF4097 and DUF4098 domain-containing protein YvlB
MRRHARISLTVLAVATASAAVRAQDPVEKVDRTVPFAAGGTVRIETFSGRIAVRGTRAPQVVIKGSRKARADRLETITLETRTRGTTLTVDVNHHGAGADKGQFVGSDLTIDVPADTRLYVKTFSAPVTVTGIDGAVEIEGFSGAVRVEGGVARAVTVKTSAGAIAVVAATAPDGQQIDLETQSGRIDLRLPAAAKAHIQFDTSSGNLVTALPIDRAPARGSGRGVSGTLNGGGAGRVRLKTASGDVHLTH